jgi:putative acetyltransferase
MNHEIREETDADIHAIEALTISAFMNAPHTSHTEHFIVNALRKAAMLSVSLIGDDRGAVIGHVAASPVSVSDGSADWYGIGPLSVAPKHQRHGVGSRLMRHALRALREKGAAGCVLLGDPEYYGRFGFQANPRLVLPNVPAQYFQAISFRTSSPQGIVSYHASFEAKD